MKTRTPNAKTRSAGFMKRRAASQGRKQVATASFARRRRARLGI